MSKSQKRKISKDDAFASDALSAVLSLLLPLAYYVVLDIFLKFFVRLPTGLVRIGEHVLLDCLESHLAFVGLSEFNVVCFGSFCVCLPAFGISSLRLCM